MEKKNDLHIKFLDYSASKSDGFTLAELCKDLGLSDLEQSLILNEIQGADIVARSGKFRGPSTTLWDEILILSFESRFKHIQFKAFKEASKSGTSALRISIVTLIISIIASGLSIYLQMKPQEINPVEIKGGTLKTEVINFPASQNVKVENSFLRTFITNLPK